MREEWEIRELKEVCTIRPPKREARSLLAETDFVSFVPMADLGINKKYLIPSEYKTLSEVYSGYTYFMEGDVLLAKITPCFENGKLGIAKDLKNGVGFGSSEYVVYRVSEKLNNEFLYYFLNQESFRKTGSSQMAGAVGHKRITKAFYEDSILPIPPLQEQQQIVAILDEAFEAIDQAIANVEKNIANAEDLLLSKKKILFDQLSKDFDTVSLEDSCNAIFAGGDAPKENFSKERTSKLNVPIIANAVKDNGLYGYTNEARVTRPSITVAARGSGTGHTEFRNYPFVPIVRLIVLTPNTEITNVEFLMHSIKTLNILRSGSAIPQLTVPMIKGYSIPLPDLKTQIQVVKVLNMLEKLLRDYTAKLGKKLIEMEELKKSILQKAFAGELTNREVESLQLVSEPEILG